MEETKNIRDYKFRIGFKQSAKGKWQAEFTVRSDTVQELSNEIEQVHYLIEQKLSKMNEETENGTNGLETN